MSEPPRILVAASPAIDQVETIERLFSEHELAFKGNEPVRVLAGNPALQKVISTRSHIQLVEANSSSRSSLLKLLKDTSHLVLIWDGKGLTPLLFQARLSGVSTKVIPFEITSVANKDANEPFDLYIGRGTPWGNPFVVGTQPGQFTREEAINLYEEHFRKKLLAEDFRRGLEGLRGLRLGCHCRPLACHGDVIAGYLNRTPPLDREHSS